MIKNIRDIYRIYGLIIVKTAKKITSVMGSQMPLLKHLTMFLPSQYVLEELNNHDQEDLQKEDDVFAFVNMSMVNTSITLSLGPTLAAIDTNENQKAGDELQGVEPPPNILNLYTFVG